MVLRDPVRDAIGNIPSGPVSITDTSEDTADDFTPPGGGGGGVGTGDESRAGITPGPGGSTNVGTNDEPLSPGTFEEETEFDSFSAAVDAFGAGEITQGKLQDITDDFAAGNITAGVNVGSEPEPPESTESESSDSGLGLMGTAFVVVAGFIGLIALSNG